MKESILVINGSTILITGGTGSLGRAILDRLLATTPDSRIIIFSRDELKQYNMKIAYAGASQVEFILGDVRDLTRLTNALHKVDYVIHTAALKQVDTGEHNPMEFIKTNILGSQNLIEAAIANGVKKVIALSTDKASSPNNLYGATKLTADKLFIAANNHSYKFETFFSVARFGNLMGSRGSVIPYFRDLAKTGNPLPITDFEMTRFWMDIDYAVEFVLQSLATMKGGELFVPKIPSFRIVELAKAISPDSKLIEIGLRPGEKLHEEMISADDSFRTYVVEDYFIVAPVIAEWGFSAPSQTKMTKNSAFVSNEPAIMLGVDDISNLLEKI